MSQESVKAIRNKPLRLTLSGHERQFIEDGWARAVRSVKFLSVLFLASVAVLVSSFSLYEPRDLQRNPIRAEEKIVNGRLTYVDKQDPARTQFYIHGAVVLVASVVGFVAALKLLFAVVELLKFRGYRNDHEKFLKQYRRKP